MTSKQAKSSTPTADAWDRLIDALQGIADVSQSHAPRATKRKCDMQIQDAGGCYQCTGKAIGFIKGKLPNGDCPIPYSAIVCEGHAIEQAEILIDAKIALYDFTPQSLATEAPINKKAIEAAKKWKEKTNNNWYKEIDTADRLEYLEHVSSPDATQSENLQAAKDLAYNDKIGCA